MHLSAPVKTKPSAAQKRAAFEGSVSPPPLEPLAPLATTKSPAKQGCFAFPSATKAFVPKAATQAPLPPQPEPSADSAESTVAATQACIAKECPADPGSASSDARNSPTAAAAAPAPHSHPIRPSTASAAKTKNANQTAHASTHPLSPALPPSELARKQLAQASVQKVPPVSMPERQP